MADIVIVNPRFDISFWGMEKCMEMLGKRANLPVACLPLLAALIPKHHNVTLIDENVEEIDFDRLGRADMVCVTGMSIQGRRLREILAEVRNRGVLTVAGGASIYTWVTPRKLVSVESFSKLGHVLAGSTPRATTTARYRSEAIGHSIGRG